MKKVVFMVILIVSTACSGLYAAWETTERSPLTLNIECYGGYAFVIGTDALKPLSIDLSADNDNRTFYGDFNNGWLTGLQLGITLPSKNIMKWQLFVGGEYFNKTLSVHVSDTKLRDGWSYDDDLFDVRYQMTVHYIDITFGCRMFISWFFIDTGAFGGIELSRYLLKQSISASGLYTKDFVEKNLDAGDDFGLLFGIGCAFPVHKHISLILGCRMHIGLFNTVSFGNVADSSMYAATVYAAVSSNIFLE